MILFGRHNINIENKQKKTIEKPAKLTIAKLGVPLFSLENDMNKAKNSDNPQWVDEHGVVYIPAGTKHNIINKGSELLKLYTVYSPPEHKDGTVHKTKADAQKEE